MSAERKYLRFSISDRVVGEYRNVLAADTPGFPGF